MPLLQVLSKNRTEKKQQASLYRKNQINVQRNLFNAERVDIIEDELRDVSEQITETGDALAANQALLLEAQMQLYQLSDQTAKMTQREALLVQELNIFLSRAKDGILIAREFNVRDSSLLKDLSLAWDTYLSKQ